MTGFMILPLQHVFRLLTLLSCQLLPLLLAGTVLPQHVEAKQFTKATEDEDEVVKNKLFPKRKKIELNGPDIGIILNQSYVASYVFHAGIIYYQSEKWGFSLEGMAVFNQDKTERHCIENFYNDFKETVAAACPAEGTVPDAPLYSGTDDQGNPLPVIGANFGPAYVPIRELDYVINAAAIWNPVYGKQLAFLTRTVYFDLFVTAGIGLAFSTYYPEQTVLKNGRLSRGSAGSQIPDDCTDLPVGVCPDPSGSHLNYIGINGRPESLSQTHPILTFGIGQKFHFQERFNFKGEVRGYSLLGTEAGFDAFYMVWMGFGLRI